MLCVYVCVVGDRCAVRYTLFILRYVIIFCQNHDISYTFSCYTHILYLSLLSRLYETTV